MSQIERANAQAGHAAAVGRSAGVAEAAHASGRYVVECVGADGTVKWRDEIQNLVTTEGKNAALTHLLKGSAYTASQTMGLIESTGYTAVAAGNTAANITAAGGGSPANGWNEAQSSVCASRGTPSFGTAGSGQLATSAAVAFSIMGAGGTMKGVFLLIRSAAGVAPSATVGNTSGAIYSAGLFSGGDRAVSAGDTINVSWTGSL